MFVHEGKYCTVKTWLHDVPKMVTQATLYHYNNVEDMVDSKNEVASDIYRFEYSPSLQTLEGIEAAIQAVLTAPPAQDHIEPEVTPEPPIEEPQN